VRTWSGAESRSRPLTPHRLRIIGLVRPEGGPNRLACASWDLAASGEGWAFVLVGDVVLVLDDLPELLNGAR
jgi:hypothetical protein